MFEFNKRLNSHRKQYPEMLDLIRAAVGSNEAILDGEFVTMETGRSNFYKIIRRDWAQNERIISALAAEDMKLRQPKIIDIHIGDGS